MKKSIIFFLLLFIITVSVNAQTKPKASDHDEVTHQITGYGIHLINHGWGWIDLTNGTTLVGVIWFMSDADLLKSENADRFDSNDVIVTHQPISMLNALLDILRKEKQISIKANRLAPQLTLIEAH